MSVIKPDRENLYRRAIDPRIYIATDWDEAKVAWTAIDTSPTANPGRYNYDPVTNKVLRKRRAKTTSSSAKTRSKERVVATDAIDLAMPAPVAVADIVARLPAERFDIKTIHEMFKKGEIAPNAVQWELVALLQPLAAELAFSRSSRSKVNVDDAVSCAGHYLLLAVLAGPVGDAVEFITGKIQNGLAELARKKRRDDKTFDGMASDGEVVKRVRDKTPVDPDNPVAVEKARAKEDKRFQQLLKRIRLKYNKQWDRHNIGLAEYDTMKSKCSIPVERNVLLLVLTGASVNRIVSDLRIKRSAVKEILTRLAV